MPVAGHLGGITAAVGYLRRGHGRRARLPGDGRAGSLRAAGLEPGEDGHRPVRGAWPCSTSPGRAPPSGPSPGCHCCTWTTPNFERRRSRSSRRPVRQGDSAARHCWLLAPLFGAIIAVSHQDDRLAGPCSSGRPASRQGRPSVRRLQVPDDGAWTPKQRKAGTHRPQRGRPDCCSRSAGRPAGDRDRAGGCAAGRWTSCRSC